MRVLLLTQDLPPRPGGMARYYADWCTGLGRDCTVAMGSWNDQPPPLPGMSRLLPLPFPAVASHRHWNLRRTAAILKDHLRNVGADVLIAGNIRPFGPLARRVAEEVNIPLVLTYHGNDLLRTARRWRRNPIKRHRWGRTVNAAALHVVNSRFTAGLAEQTGLPSERIAVVHPEVDTHRFRPPAGNERDHLRNRFGFHPNELITLFVGRLVARKGLDDLLRALPVTPPGVRLVVAGPGEITPWEALAKDCGVEDRVRFRGAETDEELSLLYRAADLFAGPSRERRESDDVEGFGIVFLEAAASGLPILATRSGGIPEAVEDGVGGVLVPGDPGSLAKAWCLLAGDPSLRNRLGTGGFEGRARSHGRGSSAESLRAALSRIAD